MFYKYLYRYFKHDKGLQKRGRIKKFRSVILERVSIENRPTVVEKRRRHGDFEDELIRGKKDKSPFIGITDRATLKI